MKKVKRAKLAIRNFALESVRVRPVVDNEPEKEYIRILDGLGPEKVVLCTFVNSALAITNKV